MHILQWRNKSKRVLNTIITTAFLATQILVPVSALSHASALNSPANPPVNPPGNNGTLQVHEQGSPVDTKSNEPHVCVFNFEVFGVDAGQTGNVTIEPQAPTSTNGTPDGNPLVLSITTDVSGNGDSAYVNSTDPTVALANGHYKATLDNKFGTDPDGKAKSKVFWVDCTTPAPPVQPTLTTQVSSSSVKAGDTVYDTATLTGDSTHGAVTGSVAFSLCGPAQATPDCTAGGTAVGTAVSVVNGQAVSANVPITGNTAAGTYCFRADFTPADTTNYLAASHTNTTTECFTVTLVPPTPTPAQPTVEVSTSPCTINTNTTDTLNVKVTNTADDTHAAVTYTVSVKSGNTVVATQTLTNLADGANGTLQFAGLAAGTYTVAISGSDGTSVTSNSVTINACAYVPAAPTAVASLVPCTLHSGLNDTVDVLVTNTADNTHAAVTYTVSFAGQTKSITLADGALGTVSFDGLATGTYSATVTASDGTGPITTNQVQVGSCPPAVPTAQVRVIKLLVPSNDSGRFNLSIDGTVKANAVGDNGTTGYVSVPVGTHSVSESAGNTSTSLSNYHSSYRCYNEQNNNDEDDGDDHQNVLHLFANTNQNLTSPSGTGTSFENLVLHSGDKVTCVFTNTRNVNVESSTVTIVKDAQPNSSQTFNFTTSLGDSFSLTDDGINTTAAHKSFTNVKPGTYTVTEVATGGWKLSSATCGQGVETTLVNGVLTLTVAAGANLTCTFTNTKIVGDVLGIFTTTPTTTPTTTSAPSVLAAQAVAAPAPAMLANTGQSVWANVVIGLAIMGAAFGLSFASRKQQLS